MTDMRLLILLTFVIASLVSSLGCSSSGDTGGGGSGGTAGVGGNGATGGAGGVGGMGGTVRTCVNPRDCDDGEPCTKELCEDGVCAYELLPNQTVCGSDTGVSACLNGTCQLIWTTCNEDGAQDGDFCRPMPEPDPPRLGRCDTGACVVRPCEINFDCWSGEACQLGICDASSGTCSTENAPDGNACIPPAGGRCSDGVCGSGTGGQGGAGGIGGEAGAGGQSGAGGQGGA
jgi:hypothetical protein